MGQVAELAEGAIAIRARLNADAYEAARERAELERARLRRRTSAPSGGTDRLADAALADLWTAIAEAEVFSGRLRAAADAARRAIDAGGSRSRTGHRAHALLAAAYAVNGEMTQARRAIWLAGRAEPGCPALALAIAEASLAIGDGDIAAAEAVVRRLGETAGVEWVRAAGILFAAFVDVFTGDAMSAAARCAALTSSIDAARLPPILQAMAVDVLSASHLIRGDGVRALSVLGEDRSDDPTHLLCRGGLAGAAHLSDPVAALRATESCLRVGAAHSLRTLPRTLLVRAIAFRQLGDKEQARLAAEEAVALSAQSGGWSAAALLGLDAREVVAMLTDVFGPRPTWRSGVADLAGCAEMLPQPASPGTPPLPRLTPRERVVAVALRSDATIPEIASSLRVSFNTVKAQTRTLYVKLGVSSREQALERLELAGFFLGESP